MIKDIIQKDTRLRQNETQVHTCIFYGISGTIPPSVIYSCSAG